MKHFSIQILIRVSWFDGHFELENLNLRKLEHELR